MELFDQAKRKALPGLGLAVASLALVAVACGASATATPRPATLASGATPTPTRAATAAPVPTAAPTPTLAPAAQVRSGKNSIILVVGEEPASLSAFSPKCTGSPEVFPCGDYSTDSLTYIDGKTFRIVPLAGTENWEQVAPDRWRFSLRKGVKFHNGEVFNADAAKFSIDFLGEARNGHLSYSYTGSVRAEVVNDATVDVVCKEPCPIYLKTAFFTRFQAPAWYKAASESDREATTVGFGPYKVKEWQHGISIKMEAYDGYQARADVVEAQSPQIREMTQFNRAEPLVRAAMVKTGEADWAFEIGVENAPSVPEAKIGGAAETVSLKVDTLWHPLLKKKEFRLALVHAMDCPSIVKSLYGGQTACTGNVVPAGTLGLTPENSKPYEYNPAKAKSLLEQASYKGEAIKLSYRVGRFYREAELIEAIASYWGQAGIRVKTQALESSLHRDLGITGCGQYKDKPLECMNQPPPPPGNASPHVWTSTQSLETLDFAKIAIANLTCASVRSQVCEPDRLEPLITKAVAATGDERKVQMEKIATILHDDVLFIGVFELFVVYGVSKDLLWEPRYDRRVRLNMMRFAK